MEDYYWPESIDGSYWNNDDDVLYKWRASLLKDRETYAGDQDSLYSINSLIRRIEEELAQRKLHSMKEGRVFARTADKDSLEEFCKRLESIIGAATYLLINAQDELAYRRGWEEYYSSSSPSEEVP